MRHLHSHRAITPSVGNNDNRSGNALKRNRTEWWPGAASVVRAWPGSRETWLLQLHYQKNGKALRGEPW